MVPKIPWFGKIHGKMYLNLEFLSTVWKIQHFPVTQILREIKFGKCQSSKKAISAILCALKLRFWYISAFRKCKNSEKSKFSTSKCVKMGVYEPSKFLKLISRKIWVIEKLWNYHTVWIPVMVIRWQVAQCGNFMIFL